MQLREVTEFSGRKDVQGARESLSCGRRYGFYKGIFSNMYHNMHHATFMGSSLIESSAACQRRKRKKKYAEPTRKPSPVEEGRGTTLVVC